MFPLKLNSTSISHASNPGHFPYHFLKKLHRKSWKTSLEHKFQQINSVTCFPIHLNRWIACGTIYSNALLEQFCGVTSKNIINSKTLTGTQILRIVLVGCWTISITDLIPNEIMKTQPKTALFCEDRFAFFNRWWRVIFLLTGLLATAFSIGFSLRLDFYRYTVIFPREKIPLELFIAGVLKNQYL